MMTDEQKVMSHKREKTYFLDKSLDTLVNFGEKGLRELPVVRIGELALDSTAAIAGNAWGFFTGMLEGFAGWFTKPLEPEHA